MRYTTYHMIHKQHTFDSFCKKVLQNEARNCYVEKRRCRRRESTFSELSDQWMDQFFTVDEYPTDNLTFTILGHDIVVREELIAKALSVLSEQKRDIILFAYYLSMTDREIAEHFGIARSTIQYQRMRALEQMGKVLEANKDGYK